tara:strand:- start:9113 stop:9463 length:351 start_codon:yes stop_codon:yes gene_type:complete
MASSFKNAGMTVATTDNSSANVYTASTNGGAVIHAVYISNKHPTNYANVDVKVTTDGGSTFHHIGKSLIIEPENTLQLDKPINMEQNDILRIVAELNSDSSTPDVECFASILEVTV